MSQQSFTLANVVNSMRGGPIFNLDTDYRPYDNYPTVTLKTRAFNTATCVLTPYVHKISGEVVYIIEGELETGFQQDVRFQPLMGMDNSPPKWKLIPVERNITDKYLKLKGYKSHTYCEALSGLMQLLLVMQQTSHLRSFYEYKATLNPSTESLVFSAFDIDNNQRVTSAYGLVAFIESVIDEYTSRPELGFNVFIEVARVSL